VCVCECVSVSVCVCVYQAQQVFYICAVTDECVFVPPVLGVRWSFLQPEQSEPSRTERQTSDPITPLLLRPEHTHTPLIHTHTINTHTDRAPVSMATYPLYSMYL